MQIPEDMGGLIKFINTWLKRNSENFLKRMSLSFSEMDVIIALWESEGKKLELKMLEARLLAPQSTIFGTVRKLESKGYTRLVQPENDRRVKIAELTEEGKNLCLLAIEDKKKDNEAMVAGLTAEEQIVLRLLLSKMARTMLNIRIHEHRCVAE